MKNEEAIPEDQIPDPDEIRERYPIEDDSDTLEPFDDQAGCREINPDDEKEMTYWMEELQVTRDQLHSAIAVNGTSVWAIKKYLSV